MQTVFYGLLILSGILGLAVGGLGCVLGYMLSSSYVNTDQGWGWAIIACSLGYLSHPALLYWLQNSGHNILAMTVTVVFIVCSGLLLFVLPSAIGAVARP